MIRLAAAALLIFPALAQAQTCDGGSVRVEADGRVLGHLPYGDIAPGLLADAPPGFALRGGCRLRSEVLPDLQRLLGAAATDPAMRGALHGLSCHRSMMHQSSVFCREADAEARIRAVSVAPPGHSEHTTGYAIDFAIRPSPNCPDAEACMAALPAARWLRDNAPRFGFELSFPPGNRQGVKWEPWHWRWVGVRADVAGAVAARATFAAARQRFPADPAIVVPPRVVPTIAPPAPPPPPAPEPARGKRKRR